LETWYVIRRTGGYLKGLVAGTETTDQLSGPIRIAEVSGAMAKIGLGALLNLAAILSISVGMLNLFPIPLLNGGHLFYYAVEAIRGKAMSEKAQQFGFNIGITLVTTLMFFAPYNDLLRLTRLICVSNFCSSGRPSMTRLSSAAISSLKRLMSGSRLGTRTSNSLRENGPPASGLIHLSPMTCVRRTFRTRRTILCLRRSSAGVSK
jgi:Peptidase family M50